MKFTSTIFKEPQLEFGDKHQDPDPRRGLFLAGPLQTASGDAIKIAVVGSAKTVEDTEKFLAAASVGFLGKSEKHPNMHPDFPGLGNQNPYRCKFEIAQDATAAIPQAKIEKIRKEPHHGKAVEMAVDEVMDVFIENIFPDFVYQRRTLGREIVYEIVVALNVSVCSNHCILNFFEYRGDRL